jgi:DNA phosphorothioation-associated putative methyltransferase
LASHYCLDELCDKDALTRVFQAKKDDLLLYFALEIFNGRRPYRTLPLKLQQDLRHLWSNYENAQIEAKLLLFSIGDSSLILNLVKQSASAGLGMLLNDEQLQFHRNILDQLPLVLRCYVACASILYGDLDSADLIKIHGNSGKVSLNIYEDFSSPLPILARRVKIDMRSQKVQNFDYIDQQKQYLYLKSTYLSAEHEDFKRQKKFDTILMRTLNNHLDKYGPQSDQLNKLATSSGLDLSLLTNNYFRDTKKHG